MVVLNGLKYACETCIKGHRSSACTHTERTLFEIKKKGRPITQCEHCRHLRKTRQVHVKCLCGTRPGNEKANGSARARLKLPTSATIRLDPNDPTHATITTGLLPLNPKPKLKSKPKPPENKCCNCGKPGQCGCDSGAATTEARPSRSSPSLPSASAKSRPPSTASTTSSRCSAKSHSPDDTTSASTSISNDKYAASLLDDLSRRAAYNAQPVNGAGMYRHHAQPFYNQGPSTSSFPWQSGLGLESCSYGPGIACGCPECYDHSRRAPMVLYASENYPYSYTTCTECNGRGFSTVPSHMNSTFVPSAHQDENWRQLSPSRAGRSTNALVRTTAAPTRT